MRYVTPIRNARSARRTAAVLAFAVTAALGTAAATRAETFIKANNNTPLSSAGSWVNGTVPTASDLLQWDNTVAATNTVVLGADLAVEGIRIANPGGSITISAGNLLTLGAGGLDLSAATVPLLISAGVALNQSQTWNVAALRTLTVAGTTNLNGQALSIAGAGNVAVSSILSGATTLTMNGSGSLTITAASNQQFTGNLVLNSGVLQANWTNTAFTTNLFNANVHLTLAGGRLVLNTTSAAITNYSQNFANAVSIAAGESYYAPTRGAGASSINLLWNGGMTREAGATFHYVSGLGQRFRIAGTNTASGIAGGWFITTNGSSTTWARVGAGSDATSAVTYTGSLFLSNDQNTDMLDNIVAGANATAGSVRFNNSVDHVTLSLNGNNVIESGGILITGQVGTNSSFIAPSMAADTLTSGNGQDLIVQQYDNAGPFTISAAVVDHGATSIGMTKSGPGTLLLSGLNTYTGKTYINNGVLSVSANSHLGSESAASAVQIHGGTLALAGSFGLFQGSAGTNDRAVIIGEKNAAISVPFPWAATISGVISGVGGLTKVGTGSLVLANANTYAGGTTIAAGALLTANASGSATGPGAVKVGAGATLGGIGTVAGDVDTVSQSVLAPGLNGIGTLTLGGLTLAADAFANFEINGLSYGDRMVITGSNGLTILGGSINLYVPGTTDPFVASGTYPLFNYAGTLNGSLAGLAVFNAPAGTSYTFTANAGMLSVTLTTLVTSAWAFDSDGNWSDASKWTKGVPQHAQDTASFDAVGGTRTITLSGDTTVGHVSFSSLNAGAGYRIAGSDKLVLDNFADPATVEVSSGNHTIAAPLQLNSDAAVHFNASDAILTCTSVVTSGGTANATTGLSLTGTGTLTLSANNTYTGSTSIGADATLQMGNGASAGALGPGTVTIGGVLAACRADAYTLANPLVGAGTLTQSGGTMTVTGANAFSGSTSILAGRLIVGAGSSIGTGGIATIAAGAALDLHGNQVTVGGLSGAGTVTNSLAASVTLTVQGGGTFTGTIGNAAGTLGLTKTGSGALVLGSLNTYTGATDIQDGTLTLTANGSVAATKGIYVHADAAALLVLSNGVNIDRPVVVEGSSAGEFVGMNGNAVATLSGSIVNAGSAPLRIGVGQGTLVLAGNVASAGVSGIPALTRGSIVFAGNGGLTSASTVGFGRANGGVLEATFRDNARFLYNGTVAGDGAVLAMSAANVVTSSVSLTLRDAATFDLGTATMNLNGVSTNTTTALNLLGGTLTAGGFAKSGAGAATLSLNGGTVAAPATLVANTNYLPSIAGLTVTIGPGGARFDTQGATLGIGATFGATANDGGLTKDGPGTLTLRGFVNYRGATTVNDGEVEFSSLITHQVGALRGNAVSIDSGTSVINATGSGTSKLHALVIGGAPGLWNARLDITDNTLVVQAVDGAWKAATMSTLADQIRSGRNAGAWNGYGITSSAMAGHGNAAMALADNADLNLASFGGQGLDANSLIITRAIVGDADLSGVVDLGDFNRWFSHVGTSSFSYGMGDFDMSGIVDLGDFNAWFSHVGVSSLGLAPPPLEGLSGGGASAVPEPASLAVLAIGGAALAGRRRRR